MIALMPSYPNWTPWTDDNAYYSAPLGILGGGCVAFALILSDEAFGYLPGRVHEDVSRLKVGDIIRLYDNTHSAVILEINSNGVVLAEGNVNSSILWGRTLSTWELKTSLDYIITRYPE